MAKHKPDVSKFEVILIEESGEPAFRGTDLFVKLHRNIDGIREILTDSGSLAVISSGDLRSNHTAGILLEDSWVADHSVERDFIPLSASMKDMLSDENATADELVAQMEPYASKIIDKTGTSEHTAAVLVAESDVIVRLAARQGIENRESISIGPLAMNHFSIDFPISE